MRIAEVSQKYGLTADTLRYYERIGLLSNINRSASGIRDYTEADCSRIEFVKCMRTCGVPIETLVEYMQLVDEGDSTVDQREAMLKEQRQFVKDRIAVMEEGLICLDETISRFEKAPL